MIKRLALVLALILALSAAPALALEPGEVVGTWYAVKASFEGFTSVPLDDITIELKRDSSMILSINGESIAGEWSILDYGEGEVVIKYTDAEGKAQSDHLKNQSGRLALYDLKVHNDAICEKGYILRNLEFDREPSDLALPEPVAVTEEDEFFGDYVASAVIIGNEYYKLDKGNNMHAYAGYKHNSGDNPEDLMKLSISFAQIEASGYEVRELSYGDKPYAAMTEFEDGKLTLPAKYILDYSNSTSRIVVDKLDNGGVRMTLVGTEGTYKDLQVYFDAKG